LKTLALSKGKKEAQGAPALPNEHLVLFYLLR